MSGCDRAPEKDAPPAVTEMPRVERPNVFIWLVDTLRPDHLSVYGYERPTSPQLEEFARDAVVFDNVYSTTTWTMPAVASLLTGVFPARHHATSGKGRVFGVRLIGEYFKPLGYHTVALSTNPWVLPYWGFKPGFDVFQGTDVWVMDGDAVADYVIGYLDKRPPGPLLCYAHLLDPHDPYTPRPPYDKMWGARLPKPVTVSRTLNGAPPVVVTDMLKAYDGEIAFADAQFGRVMDDLKRRGLYEDSLIVFVSDHGEEFFEHGRGGHGHSLYEELLRVPLIIKFPRGGLAGQRVAARVSLMDVLPTILAYVGADVPEPLDGRDLVPIIKGEVPESAEEQRNFFMESRYWWFNYDPKKPSVRSGVLRGQYKYIEQYDPVPAKKLFDVEVDPDERVNLIDREPERAAALAALLGTYQVRSPPGIHFRNVNAIEKSTTPHDFRLTLRTAGRFVDVVSDLFEDGDRVTLSDDGHVLRMEVRGVNQPEAVRPGGRDWWVIDEDRILFHVEPPDATIVVEQYTCDSVPDACLRVGAERKPIQTLPYEFSAATEEVVAEDISMLVQSAQQHSLKGPPGGYLAVVPERPAEDWSGVDEDMLSRLRALGYVD